MDVFKLVKERVDILDVCRILGIQLNRNNMCLCPFHKEKTPSFSVLPSKNIFNCFGCGKKGDSITLVSEMLNLKPLESVKYINERLNLGIEIGKSNFDNAEINKYVQRKKAIEEFNKWENETFQLLCDFYRQLDKWEKIGDPQNEKYIYALKNKAYIGYLIDEVFIYGTNEEKLWFKRNNREVVKKICQMRKA